MGSRDSILLTLPQARSAVCADFRRYGPQLMLFSEVIRFLTRGAVSVKREPEKSGLWVSAPARTDMQWLEGKSLVDYLCQMLSGAAPDPGTMAGLCARVFHTRAFPDQEPATGREAVRIETGMEGFLCRQCGRCCLALDYHDELTAEDVERWEALGRTDILAWVRTYPRHEGGTAYRIWVRPGTNEIAEICPFLYRDKGRRRCRIHDVKPAICRQYPLTRKHAVMTGCPGFQKKPHSETP